MASSASKLDVKTYETLIRQLAQQSDTRLRPWVQERNERSAQKTFPRIASRNMAAKTSPTMATPLNNAVFSNRVAVPLPFNDGDAIGSDEVATIITDPMSAIVQSQSAAARRKIDSVIIAACGAVALDEAGNQNEFPAGQIAGDYSTEFDFEMVTLVNEMFLTNDVPADEPKVFVVGPKQARKLLHLPGATSSDYASARQLDSGGYVKSWMGFDWIVSNLLSAPQAGQRQCWAFTRKAIGLLMAEDIKAKVGEDPSISFATRAYIEMSLGAVRVEDEQIVQVQAKDTVTIN